MIVDAHQHFWTLSRGDYAWPNEDVAAIFRDFTPDDLAPLLAENGVDQTILVQATDSVAETEFMLDVASRFAAVAGVVGWVDVAAPDAIETIDRLAMNPKLKGFRPMLQAIPDTQWILQDSAQITLAHMAKRGLRFDALIQPRHLQVMQQLSLNHPTLPIVIDHIAKPNIATRDGLGSEWQNGINLLAAYPNVFCKLSGMITEAQNNWSADDLAPYAEVIIQAFGAERVMFGSDWPVVNLAGDYTRWLMAAQHITSHLSDTQKAQIFSECAKKFYNI